MDNMQKHLANKKVGTEEVVSRFYDVYDLGPAIPLAMRLGISSFDEALALAQKRLNTSIVETSKVIRVIRVIR